MVNSFGCSWAMLKFYTQAFLLASLYLFPRKLSGEKKSIVLHIFQSISVLCHQEFLQATISWGCTVNPKFYFHRSGLSKRFGFSGPPFWNGLPAPFHKKDCFSAPAHGSLLLKGISFPHGLSGVFFFSIISFYRSLVCFGYLVMICLKYSRSPVMTMDRNFCVIFQLANDTCFRANSVLIRY